jgi:catechol 2,3-dioxygenase-like lactoylglutathione lyase family enzyme
MDMKLELVIVPVTDVDRTKNFYEGIGFKLDIDTRVDPNLRFVQLTPPGSACSIAIGQGITDMKPGSLEGLQVVVASAAKARTYLQDKGLEIGEVEVHPWGSFVYFRDPDGNKWAVQELPDYNAKS